jgi:hypothetical protein
MRSAVVNAEPCALTQRCEQGDAADYGRRSRHSHPQVNTLPWNYAGGSAIEQLQAQAGHGGRHGRHEAEGRRTEHQQRPTHLA